MRSFPVTTDQEDQLARRMATLGVREADLDETFVRAGGPGGQNVNKTSTCVLLVHRPSGIQVRCQTTRHQGMNRYLARRSVLDKIEAARAAHAAAERASREKIRRQKRPRSRAAKLRILEAKSRHAAKKATRRAVVSD